MHLHKAVNINRFYELFPFIDKVELNDLAPQKKSPERHFDETSAT